VATLDRVRDVSLDDEKVDTYTLWAEEPGGDVHFKFGENSLKVAGIAKLSNIFLKRLFTKRGSNPVDLNEGTEFTDLIGSNISDEEELIIIIQDSINETQQQITDSQANLELPADERLASANLYKFEKITGDRIEIYIELITLAGTTALIKAPKVELS